MNTTFESHGNHEILDFVNTLGNRFYAEEVDKLRSYDDLLTFCRQFEILTKEEVANLAAGSADQKVETLAAALRLRELLFDVLIQIAGQNEAVKRDMPDDSALRELGEYLHAAEQARVLALSDGGLTWQWVNPKNPMRPASELALIAKNFIDDCDRNRLRKCAMHDCGVLFFDRSRGGRRMWCSMSECGNRAKVARFRTRHAGGLA